MNTRKQRGFSMAEMLIAIAITTIVMATTLAMFDDALRVNEFATLMGDMDQNLRAGVNLIVRDLAQCGTGGMPTGGLPAPSGAGSLPINRPSPPLMNYTFFRDPVTLTTDLPYIIPGDGLGPTINNVAATDIVAIMYADSTLPLNQTFLNAITASSMTVNAGTPIAAGVNTDIRTGDLIMLSNANGNALVEITRTTGTQTVFFLNGAGAYQLNQTAAASGSVMCLQNPGTNVTTNCAANNGGFPPTTATRVWMISYYLDANTDPLLPRLVRRVNFDPARPGRPVALVIENLQLSFDVVDGVTNPTNLATVPDAANPTLSPNQIRKVNLFLAARSTTEYRKTRQFLRNSVTTQVSLRGLSFVDRYF